MENLVKRKFCVDGDANQLGSGTPATARSFTNDNTIENYHTELFSDDTSVCGQIVSPRGPARVCNADQLMTAIRAERDAPGDIPDLFDSGGGTQIYISRDGLNNFSGAVLNAKNYTLDLSGTDPIISQILDSNLNTTPNQYKYRCCID